MSTKNKMVKKRIRSILQKQEHRLEKKENSVIQRNRKHKIKDEQQEEEEHGKEKEKGRNAKAEEKD